jgi:hypothetical protein
MRRTVSVASPYSSVSDPQKFREALLIVAPDMDDRLNFTSAVVLPLLLNTNWFAVP